MYKNSIFSILFILTCSILAFSQGTIQLTGNSIVIPNNSTNVSYTDSTYFGITYQGKVTNQKFTINNIGAGPLTISSITVAPNNVLDLSIGLSSSIIANGSFQSFYIGYSPFKTSVDSAIVTIVSDDPVNPVFTFKIKAESALDPNIFYSQVFRTFGDEDFKIKISSNSPAPFKYVVDTTVGQGYENGNQIISVDSVTGLIHIKKAGVAKVKASQKAVSGYLAGDAYAIVNIVRKKPEVDIQNFHGFVMGDTGLYINYFNYDTTYDSYAWYELVSGTAATIDSTGKVTPTAEGIVTIKAMFKQSNNFEYIEKFCKVKIYINPIAPVAVNDIYADTVKELKEFDTFQLQIASNDSGVTGYVDRKRIDLNPDDEGIQNAFVNGQGKFEVDTNGLITYTVISPTLTKSICKYTITDSRGMVSNVAEISFDISLNSPPPLKAPDMITPNNDDKNDYFVIGYLDEDIDNELYIYDKKGKLVYSMINYDNTWDGVDVNSKQKLQADQYFFYIYETSGAYKRNLKGSFNINY